MIEPSTWFLNLYEGQRIKANEKLNINVDYYANIDTFQDYEAFDASITIDSTDEIIVLQSGEFYFEDELPFNGNSFQGSVGSRRVGHRRVEVERNPLFLILKDAGYLYFVPIEILNQGYFSPIDV